MRLWNGANKGTPNEFQPFWNGFIYMTAFRVEAYSARWGWRNDPNLASQRPENFICCELFLNEIRRFFVGRDTSALKGRIYEPIRSR